MTSFAELIQQGAGNAWLFMPSAILLGALHGLEPGHSKTLMAAFIVAIRGTVWQAVMLGLAATVSHTVVVWVIALGGLYLWRGVAPETFEPWLQFVSGLIIIAMAIWMVWRTAADRRLALAASRDHACHDHSHDHHDGSVSEPAEYEDAHQRAHADDIRRRFTGKETVTNWQILVFGLTGGLIPCPAAITVLLLCLQLKEIPLGAVMVLCFSIGLAVTLVAVGAVAAVGVRHAAQRVSWFSEAARRAPYFSGVLIALVGVYVTIHGLRALWAV